MEFMLRIDRLRESWLEVYLVPKGNNIVSINKWSCAGKQKNF